MYLNDMVFGATLEEHEEQLSKKEGQQSAGSAVTVGHIISAVEWPLIQSKQR